MTPRLVTLLTDFGLRDGYVAAMKGAMLARVPELRIFDVSHEIPPGDVAAAAWVLHQSAPHFPPHTVHLVVVDPGVGSGRRALATRIGPQLYVAPDNGVLTRVLAADRALGVRAISAPEFASADASPVFHGRDIFGPVAAHLAAGGALEVVGEALDPAVLVRCPDAEARHDGGVWTGAVVYVDRFGNLGTNVPVEAEVGVAVVGGCEIPLRRTYSDVSEGELVALRGSSGWLEIARNRGSAAEALGARRGAVVILRVPQRS